MSENWTSKFWRQIQILPVFSEIRRYLGPEVEIEKSGSTIFFKLESFLLVAKSLSSIAFKLESESRGEILGT